MFLSLDGLSTGYFSNSTGSLITGGWSSPLFIEKRGSPHERIFWEGEGTPIVTTTKSSANEALG